MASFLSYVNFALFDLWGRISKAKGKRPKKPAFFFVHRDSHIHTLNYLTTNVQDTVSLDLIEKLKICFINLVDFSDHLQTLQNQDCIYVS